MIRRAPVVAVLLLLAACEGGPAPTGPAEPDPRAIVIDGTTDGNSHLFFLPPVAASPALFVDPADMTLRPRVHICEWSAGDCVDGGVEFLYTTTSGPGGTVVELVDDHYQVDWDTQLPGVEVGVVFRASILIVGLELGSVDLQMAENGREVRNLNADAAVGLVDGRTLPLNFRIGEGAVEEAEAAAEQEPGGVCYDASGNVIDCDVEIIDASEGGSATVFQDPGGTGETLAALVTIQPDDAFDENGDPVSDFQITLQHVADAPSAELPESNQIPFFIEATAVDAEGDPVFFQQGAFLTLCQPPDLGDPLAPLYLPNSLHHSLRMFRVHEGVTELLATGFDEGAYCPGGIHGGLNTVRTGRFSGFGATLPTDPSLSTAVVPNGVVGAPTVIDIQAMVDADPADLPQVYGGDEVVVTVTGDNSASLTLGSGVTDDGDGTYTAEYTPASAGTDMIAIEIHNVETGNLEPISGSPFTSVVTGAGPDLVVSSVLSVDVFGGAATLTYTVANIGGPSPDLPGNSTFDVAVYLSDDAVLDASDVLAGWLTSVWQWPLVTGWSQTFTVDGPLPTGTLPGTYHLIVVADAFPGQPPNYYPGVVESNEANNWTASPAFTVTSGFGAATVDGIKGVGEWDNASSVDLAGVGPLAGSKLYVMNDGTNVYVAFEIIGDPTAGDDFVHVRFDNDLDGVDTVGDDLIGLYPAPGFVDGYFNGSTWGPESPLFSHGGGATDVSGGVQFFEIFHPLSSGDATFDFDLTGNDLVGFCALYSLNSFGFLGAAYPAGCQSSQAAYRMLRIVPPPIP